jgi:hypothetical protein
MEEHAAKCYFPSSASRSKITIQAERILLLSIPASNWLGEDFESVRPTDDVLRSNALLLFLIEVVIRSKNVLAFETVYDSVLAAHDIRRVVFIRLWIFLETDERADAFNQQAQALVTPRDEKTKGAKRLRVEDEEPKGYAMINSASELLRALLQARMSQVGETLHISFDRGGMQQDIVTALDADASDADDADTIEDPVSSLVAHLSIDSHFDSEIMMLAERDNRVDEDQSTKAMYTTVNAEGDYVWEVADEADVTRVRVVDYRGAHGLKWLSKSSDLSNFKHPSHEPSAHELRTWIQMQSMIVGVSAHETRNMTKDELQEKVDTYMHTPALVRPVKCLRIAKATVTDWSGIQYSDTYPQNAMYMDNCKRANEAIERAISESGLDPAERRLNALHVTSQLELFTATKLQGFPAAYHRVRKYYIIDIDVLNQTIDSSAGFDKECMTEFMFPDKTAYDPNMNWTTIFLVQLVEILRCEFGLDRPQTHMDTLIYIWSFLLLIPRFGCPGSIQARGPPGSGKGEGKRRLQPCVNFGLWINMDTMSVHATSLQGLPEQCFWDHDENPHQDKKDGSTTIAQTADSNGVTKRARANIKENKTTMDPVACRHVILSSYNQKLPKAMEDRAVNLDLPHNEGETRTDQTEASQHYALCLRYLTGCSLWGHLWEMGNQISMDETCLSLFVCLAKEMVPSNIVAKNARKISDIKYAAWGLTMFEINSMYIRRNGRRELRENNTYEFLSFMRANAMLSPTAIWTAFLLITAGEDEHRDEKVLAIFKANLSQVSGGMYESIEDGDYYLTSIEQLPADRKDKELEDKANASGLGVAIMADTIDTLRKKKHPCNGKPFLKVVDGTSGRAKHPRYAVLAQAVASLKVLTETERAILEYLSQQVKAGNVMISVDETQYVFKEAHRTFLLAPHGVSPTLKHGKTSIMAAVSMLTNMGIGFECESGLVKYVAVVHDEQLPGDHVAVPGGPLNPTGAAPVFFGGLPNGQCIAIDTDGLHRYERQRDGIVETEGRKATAEEKFGNLFFRACGAKEGEVVFAGVGGGKKLCQFMTLKTGSIDPVVIKNPKYTQRVSRMSKCVTSAIESPLFPIADPTVTITTDLKLCAKINAQNVLRYDDTDGLAYNYP